MKKNEKQLPVSVAIEYWYSDREDIRSPFPKYIKPQLKVISEAKFTIWESSLEKADINKITDQDRIEKFEEILFGEALKMVETDEERITIRYPFMMRLGDRVDSHQYGSGSVVSREIVRRDDSSFLKIVIKSEVDEIKWETEFEVFE